MKSVVTTGAGVAMGAGCDEVGEHAVCLGGRLRHGVDYVELDDAG